MSFQKRRAVWRLGGDIRGDGAILLLRLWEALNWTEEEGVSEGSGRSYGVRLGSVHTLIVLTQLSLALSSCSHTPRGACGQSLPQSSRFAAQQRRAYSLLHDHI